MPSAGRPLWQRQRRGMWSSVHSSPRRPLAPALQCHGLGSCPACSLTCLVLFVLAALPLPCPGWLAAPLRTGNGSSGPEGRSSRDRPAPSAGMQPQPSLCSSASKCEGGTFWLPSPWLILKSLAPLSDPWGPPPPPTRAVHSAQLPIFVSFGSMASAGVGSGSRC